MIRRLEKSEFMPLAKNAFEDITDHSVGFIKCLAQNPKEVVLAGSGTLVSAFGVKAILTAEHVLANLPTSGHVGLLTPMRFGPGINRLTVDMQCVQRISIAKGDDDSKGPDLGLLILAPADWSKLPTGKIFYDLPRRSDLMLNNPPEENRGAWVLCGMVGERTRSLPEEDCNRYGSGKSFEGICINVVPTGRRECQNFDYVSVQVEHNQSYEGPESFGGCSGGGLWQLLVSEKPNGSLEIFASILAGVAFYESRENVRHTIVCHGSRSIYSKVIEALEQLAKVK